MGEPSRRARRWYVTGMLLTIPAVIAMMALFIGAAYADHAGPHVRIVASGDAGHDLAVTPLEINVGETAAIDLVIDFASPADSLYAAEFHMVITSDGGSVRLIDADPNTPAG